MAEDVIIDDADFSSHENLHSQGLLITVAHYSTKIYQLLNRRFYIHWAVGLRCTL